MRRSCSAALALALSLPLAATARAETAAEALYGQYHQAIEVAKLCRGVEFDQGDIDRMAAVIHEKIGHDLGAKRLKLLTEGQRQARALIEAKGCETPEALDLLALYDQDLSAAVD